MSDYSNGYKFKYQGTLKKPSGSTVPITIHEHLADKAGKHYDLRLGGKGDWAIRHFPETIGEKRLAVQQPTHPLDYYGFSGRIESGYGKGDVKIKYKGDASIQEWTPDKIKFSFDGKRYALIKTYQSKGSWLIMRTSDMEKQSSSHLYTMLSNSGNQSGKPSFRHTSVISRNRLRDALKSGEFADALSELGAEGLDSKSDASKKKSKTESPKHNGKGITLRAVNRLDHEDISLSKGVVMRGYKDLAFNRYT